MDSMNITCKIKMVTCGFFGFKINWTLCLFCFRFCLILLRTIIISACYYIKISIFKYHLLQRTLLDFDANAEHRISSIDFMADYHVYKSIRGTYSWKFIHPVSFSIVCKCVENPDTSTDKCVSQKSTCKNLKIWLQALIENEKRFTMLLEFIRCISFEVLSWKKNFIKPNWKIYALKAFKTFNKYPVKQIGYEIIIDALFLWASNKKTNFIFMLDTIIMCYNWMLVVKRVHLTFLLTFEWVLLKKHWLLLLWFRLV